MELFRVEVQAELREVVDRVVYLVNLTAKFNKDFLPDNWEEISKILSTMTDSIGGSREVRDEKGYVRYEGYLKPKYAEIFGSDAEIMVRGHDTDELTVILEVKIDLTKYAGPNPETIEQAIFEKAEKFAQYLKEDLRAIYDYEKVKVPKTISEIITVEVE